MDSLQTSYGHHDKKFNCYLLCTSHLIFTSLCLWKGCEELQRMSVSLSVHLTQTPHGWTSPNFLHMLPEAPSSSDGTRICYVLLVLWMMFVTLSFDIMVLQHVVFPSDDRTWQAWKTKIPTKFCSSIKTRTHSELHRKWNLLATTVINVHCPSITVRSSANHFTDRHLSMTEHTNKTYRVLQEK